eukprot:GHVS01026878.1.p2 GENE.GHVS01026878.1~~GHVS01026878.1.p2  ORF type:complete len:146 (-),score=16.50 GHVS01026878.1:455-892(-)
MSDSISSPAERPSAANTGGPSEVVVAQSDNTHKDNAEQSPDNAILVSLEKLPHFYCRLAKKLMTGRDGQPAHEQITLSGLGMAMKIAIGAASLLEAEGAADIKLIETCVFESSRNRRRLPKIVITMDRTAAFAALPQNTHTEPTN